MKNQPYTLIIKISKIKSPIKEFENSFVAHETDPQKLWVTLHVAELCRCGTPYSELQSIPTEDTAFASFIPQDSNRVFVDPDGVSHVLDYNEAETQLL